MKEGVPERKTGMCRWGSRKKIERREAISHQPGILRYVIFHNYATLSGISKIKSYFTSTILSAHPHPTHTQTHRHTHTLSLCSLIWKTSRRLRGPSSLSAATPCSIKLACNSPDESPAGLREGCEVKNPLQSLLNLESRRKTVLETHPVRVT